MTENCELALVPSGPICECLDEDIGGTIYNRVISAPELIDSKNAGPMSLTIFKCGELYSLVEVRIYPNGINHNSLLSQSRVLEDLMEDFRNPVFTEM
jgi:hypothetical protein